MRLGQGHSLISGQLQNVINRNVITKRHHHATKIRGLRREMKIEEHGTDAGDDWEVQAPAGSKGFKEKIQPASGHQTGLMEWLSIKQLQGVTEKETVISRVW